MQSQKVCRTHLSKRLLTVANMVTMGYSVADVGCDHGFVSIFLVESKRSPRVVAMDINDGPLLRAKEHVAGKKMTEYIEVRKSDGAQALEWIDQSKNKLEVDCMIAAGIGGRLTIKIIKDSLDKIRGMKEIVLQPQSDIFLVRDFLDENNFIILDEDMVMEDGKFYTIIKVKPSLHEKMNLGEYEKNYGPILIKNKNATLEKYLTMEMEKYKLILYNLQSTGHRKDTKQNDMDLLEGKIKGIANTLELMVR